MRREAAKSRAKPALPPTPTVRLLLQDIADGIRVLQTRDGVDLSNEQILERARNIVTGLLGNYRIRSLEAREFRGPRGNVCKGNGTHCNKRSKALFDISGSHGCG